MTEPLNLHINGFIDPTQKLTYIHVPFEVPDGIGRIDVQYVYDSAVSSDPTVTDGNTVDIGIFDTRGITFLNSGYRGWTGSARSSFFITSTTATPGYMPGPIQPGTWHVCLGAYKIAAQGCRYQLDIQLTPTDYPISPDFPSRLRLNRPTTPQPRIDGWYAGELHCHTVNSDGDSTVEDLVRQAEALGLDFLAITDHNNLTHQVDLTHIESPLVLIPGLEVTTYYGHWNIWGDGDWIDFRIQSADDLQRAMSAAREQGYLVSCNHPRPYGPEWVFTEVTGYQCVEIWNGPWELLNVTCLHYWEQRLARGERLSAVGGSDHHFSKQAHIARLGHPTTFIHAPRPPTASAVLDAVRAGRSFVTESPTGPQLWITSGDTQMGESLARPTSDILPLEVNIRRGEGALLEIYGASGCLWSQVVDGENLSLALNIPLVGSPYVRAQLLSQDGQRHRALTNPIYID